MRAMTPADEQGRLWSDGARMWEEAFEAQRAPLFDAALDAGGVGAGSDVLDAGCGSGGVARRAAARGARVAGFDLAEGMIALARRNVPGGDFRVGGLDAPPFQHAAFDAVIACDCLFHADDPAASIASLGGVCRPWGTVVIALWDEPDRTNFSGVFRAIVAALPAPPGTTPLTLSEHGLIESLIEDAGLTASELHGASLDYRFTDFDQYWRAARMLGLIQAMIRAAGEDRVREAALSAAAPFIASSGEVLFRHAYRVASARLPAG